MKKYIFGGLLLALVAVAPVFGQVANVSLDQQIAYLREQIAKLTQQLNQLVSQKQPGGACYGFDRDLKLGDGGMAGGARARNEVDNQVNALRRVLTNEGLGQLVSAPGEAYAGISITESTFDQNTFEAVKKFQAKYGIPATGYVGPLTRTKLNELYGCAREEQFVTPSRLPDGQVGEYYGPSGPNNTDAYTLRVHGLTLSGADRVAWKVVAGALPPGLNLQKVAVTGCAAYPQAAPVRGSCLDSDQAQIFGTPTKPGKFNFTIEVGDGLATTTQDYTLEIEGDDLIAVTSPNGGEQWKAFSVKYIRWDYEGAERTDRVDLYLDPEPPTCELPLICMINMTPWELDKDISARNGSYGWIVGTDIKNKTIPPGNYRVRVCRAGSQEVCDDSSNYFTITE